jgi:fluoride exporter
MKPLLAVAVGGIVGTALRLGADLLLPHGGAVFPLGTLLVNVAGSLVLGFLVARIWPVAPPWLRAGAGAGLLGSFTTFSALTVSAVELTAAGAGATAAGYLAASLLAGLLAATAGLRLGSPRRPPAIGVDE